MLKTLWTLLPLMAGALLMIVWAVTMLVAAVRWVIGQFQAGKAVSGVVALLLILLLPAASWLLAHSFFNKDVFRTADSKLDVLSGMVDRLFEGGGEEAPPTPDGGGGEEAPSSPDYAPYTLSGTDTYRRREYADASDESFTIRFDAAVTAKTEITLYIDMNDGVDRPPVPYEESTHEVTLIAVRPDSGYTIDGGFYGFSYMAETEDKTVWIEGVPGMPYFRANDGTFRRVVTDMGHDDTEFVLYEDSLSRFRLHGSESDMWGNAYSLDCGVLIQLDGADYFVTYADSAIAAGLLDSGV